MRARPGRWILPGLALLVAACNFGAGTSSVGLDGLVTGTVTYAEHLDSGASRPATETLKEVPATNAQVQLFTRAGRPLSNPEVVSTDGQGRFSLARADGDGLYLAEALIKGRYRVRALVRVRTGNRSEAQLNTGSTLLTDRLTRTRLTLGGLDVPRFNGIVAQARNLMTEADAPDLGTPALIAAGTDAYLDTHATIRQQLEILLSELAGQEGFAGDPTAIMPSDLIPSARPSAVPTATPIPEPTFTPEPTPAPAQENVSTATPLQLVGSRSLDAPAAWIEPEGSNLLWVSCPASNSIMRFERTDPTWRKSYPLSPRIGGSFQPGQLAVLASPAAANGPAVWVGNRHPQGTKVAVYSLLGNYLASIDAGGYQPEVVALDEGPAARHLWIGCTSGDVGRVVVCDLAGNVLKSDPVDGRPLRFLPSRTLTTGGNWYYEWIATPRKIYRVMVDGLESRESLIYMGNGNIADLSQSNVGLLRVGTIRAMTMDTAGRPWIVVQDATHTVGALFCLDPADPAAVSGLKIYPFDTTGPVISVIYDFTGKLWVATEKQIIRFYGDDTQYYPRPEAPLSYFPPGRRLQGLVRAGPLGLFWAAFDAPSELIKLPPGP